VQRELVRLARIISVVLHLAAGTLIVSAIVVVPIYFERAHFIWVWLPFSDYRFRIMVRQYSTPIRTVFSETHDRDVVLSSILLWLGCLVMLLNVIIRAAAGLSLEIWKAKVDRR
jgi:hypothetical protein